MFSIPIPMLLSFLLVLAIILLLVIRDMLKITPGHFYEILITPGKNRMRIIDVA